MEFSSYVIQTFDSESNTDEKKNGEENAKREENKNEEDF